MASAAAWLTGKALGGRKVDPPEGMPEVLHEQLLELASRGDTAAFDTVLSSWGFPHDEVRINLWRWYTR